MKKHIKSALDFTKSDPAEVGGWTYIKSTEEFLVSNSFLGKIIMDDIFVQNKSIKEWRKGKLKSYNYTLNGTQHKTKPFNYDSIKKHLFTSKNFSYLNLNIPKKYSKWLDESIDLGIHVPNTPIIVNNLQTYYGNTFPIKPGLLGPGIIYLSFNCLLLTNLRKTRKWLIVNSDKCLSHLWFKNFKLFIIELISVIDITLIQLYIKAEYDPKPGWTFNSQNLGPRQGTRFNDKINWVYKITNNHINDNGELKEINKIKEIRNHLNHFDPPSFVLNIVEIVELLNKTHLVGIILFKIRRAMGEPCSEELINFLIQPKVELNLNYKISKGIFDPKQHGYESSIW